MRRLGLTLNALRSFEAVARHRSFKQAAAELGVTASAVSHQVALLERQLAARLLQRDARGVELTAYGAALLPKLTAGFELLWEAVSDHLTRVRDGPLRVSLLDTFALYWLMPRLRDYPLEQAGFGLEIETSQRTVSFETENLDLAVRLGHGVWPGLEAEHLFPEMVAVVVRPGREELLRTGPVFVARMRAPDWAAWREQFGQVLAPDLPQVDVDSTALAIKAALEGTGLALAGSELVRLEVEAGRLAWVGAGVCPSVHGGYWLVYPKLTMRDPRAQNFRAWLLKAAGGAAA